MLQNTPGQLIKEEKKVNAFSDADLYGVAEMLF